MMDARRLAALALLFTVAASAYLAFAPTRPPDDSPQVASATAELKDGRPVMVAPEQVSLTVARGSSAWALLALPPLIGTVVVAFARTRPVPAAVGGLIVIGVVGVVEALVVGRFVYVPATMVLGVAAVRVTGLTEPGRLRPP